MTHVFTWSTCLHRSHVDHFLVTALQSVFCGPSSLVAPSASTDPGGSEVVPAVHLRGTLGPSRARSTWLHRKAERFSQNYLTEYILTVFTQENTDHTVSLHLPLTVFTQEHADHTVESVVAGNVFGCGRASSGSIRLPRCSPRDRFDFRLTSELGCTTGILPSWCGVPS